MGAARAVGAVRATSATLLGWTSLPVAPLGASSFFTALSTRISAVAATTTAITIIIIVIVIIIAAAVTTPATLHTRGLFAARVSPFLVLPSAPLASPSGVCEAAVLSRAAARGEVPAGLQGRGLQSLGVVREATGGASVAVPSKKVSAYRLRVPSHDMREFAALTHTRAAGEVRARPGGPTIPLCSQVGELTCAASRTMTRGEVPARWSELFGQSLLLQLGHLLQTRHHGRRNTDAVAKLAWDTRTLASSEVPAWRRSSVGGWRRLWE